MHGVTDRYTIVICCNSAIHALTLKVSRPSSSAMWRRRVSSDDSEVNCSFQLQGFVLGNAGSYQMTGCHIPQDCNLDTRRHETFISLTHLKMPFKKSLEKFCEVNSYFEANPTCLRNPDNTAWHTRKCHTILVVWCKRFVVSFCFHLQGDYQTLSCRWIQRGNGC